MQQYFMLTEKMLVNNKWTDKIQRNNVILTDIKASDLSKIENIFKNALFAQLIYDTKQHDLKQYCTTAQPVVFA